MTETTRSRYDVALNISKVISLKGCIDALREAINACRNDAADPLGDPAVRLIALRAAELASVDGSEYQKLYKQCLHNSRDAAGIPRLLQIMSQPIAYDADRKEEFRREAMTLLKRVAQALGLEKGSYRLSFNPGGIAVSGDASLEETGFYVQISQSVMLGHEILYRSCDGLNDYRGKRNHFAPAAALCDPTGFAKRLHADLALTRPLPDSTDTLL